VVIQLVEYPAQRVSKSDEIDDILVFVERTVHVGRYAVIVAVETLAYVAAIRDEMRRAEDQVFFIKSHPVVFRHFGVSSCGSRLAAVYKLLGSLAAQAVVSQGVWRAVRV
jgi:hypothetical protein